MKNWKTTVAGIATIIAAVAHAATQFASGGIGAVDFTVLTAGVTAGIGLLGAKDFNVTGGTSQQ